MSTRIAFEGVVETKLPRGRATKADVERFLKDFDALRIVNPVVWIIDALGLTGYSVDCVGMASTGFFERRARVRQILAVTSHSGVRMAATAISVTTTPLGLPIGVCDNLAEAHRKAEAFLQARAAQPR
jgi:hypothetical protein